MTTFVDFSADNDTPPTEIESLCMACQQNGMTKVLLTKIPHFREVAIMAFECPHCNFRNSEVMDAGKIAEKGVKYILKANGPKDCNRQVIKGNHATISIPELEFEIPPATQAGTIATVEGVLFASADSLEMSQIVRRATTPDIAEKIDIFIAKLRLFADGEQKFTFILDDPYGNSFVENPDAPNPDHSMTVKHYERTDAENKELGLMPPDDEEKPATTVTDTSSNRPAMASVETDQKEAYTHLAKLTGVVSDEYTEPEEILTLPGKCYLCHTEGENRMYVAHIPHFREVILMCFKCDGCGFKSTEIKPGGPIPDKGKRFILKCENMQDLSRDILKADSAMVLIPEVALEMPEGTLGGKFTTVEGLLRSILDSLAGSNPFITGDSSEKDQQLKFKEFIDKVYELADGKKPFTLIIEDPLGNSYIEDLYRPDPDPRLSSEEFERTWQQNEDLGLNDIDV